MQTKNKDDLYTSDYMLDDLNTDIWADSIILENRLRIRKEREKEKNTV